MQFKIKESEKLTAQKSKNQQWDSDRRLW